MAEYLSDREIRLRRSQIQKEEEERNRKEQLERELIDKELEVIRKQREQLRQIRQSERVTEVNTMDTNMEHTDRQKDKCVETANRTADPDESYIDRSLQELLGHDTTVFSIIDEIGFNEDHISQDSTHIFDDETRQTNTNRKDESRDISAETGKLDRLLRDLSRLDSYKPENEIYSNKRVSIRDEGINAVSFRERNQEDLRTRTGENERHHLSYRQTDTEDLKNDAFERRMSLLDSVKKAEWNDMSEEKKRFIEEGSLKEEIKRKEQEMLLLKEEKTRERKAIQKLKEKELELDKLLDEQEEFKQRLLLRQKEQEYEFLMEKKRLKEEVETFKKQFIEENMRKETELRQNQEMLEERMRRDIETKLRKEIHESIRKENERRKEQEEIDKQRKRDLEEKKLLEIERNQLEMEERRRKRVEKEKIITLKREKQKEEEDRLLKSIQELKVKEEKDRNEKCFESSDDEESREIEERLKKLRLEKESLEKRNRENALKAKTEKKEELSAEGSQKILSKPKIPQFDGTQFEEWKLEIRSLIETKLYKEYILAQAVRNSITGKARKPSASTKEILKKMEDIYGNIRSGDSIIHDCYSAKQIKGEPCSEWGVRLETLFYQALERGEIEESRKDNKLKERFWRGLSSEKIKIATRSAYESSGSFDNLRKKARIEELEIESETTQYSEKGSDIKKETPSFPDKVNVCQPVHKAEETNSKMDALLKKMMELEKEIKYIKRNQNENSESRRGTGGYRPRPYGGNYKYRQYENPRADDSKKPEEKKKENAPEKQAAEDSLTKNKNLN